MVKNNRRPGGLKRCISLAPLKEANWLSRADFYF